MCPLWYLYALTIRKRALSHFLLKPKKRAWLSRMRVLGRRALPAVCVEHSGTGHLLLASPCQGWIYSDAPLHQHQDGAREKNGGMLNFREGSCLVSIFYILFSLREMAAPEHLHTQVGVPSTSYPKAYAFINKFCLSVCWAPTVTVVGGSNTVNKT